jgi:hypothetical protein
MATVRRAGLAGPSRPQRTSAPVEDLMTDPVVRAVMSEARQAYVVVDLPSGPHVTPQLFASSGDRCIFLSAATTLKVQVLRQRPQIGVTFIAGARAVVMGGTAAVLDALRPASVVAHLRDVPVAGGLLPAFVLRNAADLAGFARDFTCGRLGFHIPPRRVLIVARPDRLAVVEGASVIAAAGTWRGSVSSGGAPSVAPGGDAVVGWRTPDGPLALPGRLDRTDALVQLPNGLIELAAAPERGAACVVVDDYGGPGPALKRGVMQRGTGTVTTADGQTWFGLEPARVTTWRGIDSNTVPATAPVRRTPRKGRRDSAVSGSPQE